MATTFIKPIVDPANPAAPNLPRLAGLENVPAHVPKALIRTTGIPFHPQFLADPFAFFASMHANFPPIYFDVGPMGNAWHLLKHEDALFALRRSEYFSSASATPFPRDPSDYFHFLPIEVDPPEHRKYRAIIDPMVSPQAVLGWEPRIRGLANDLIDEVIDKGECEFTEAFGRPLPVCVFLDLMGLPQDMRDIFVTWAVDLLHSNDQAVMARTMQVISDYLKDSIADKQVNPDEGMISRIVHAAPDGQPMSEKEIFGFVIFLFIAGLDTVFATMNNMWLWLARNPDRRHEMIKDPGNINVQVEELLRVFSVTFSGRLLIKDLEMRGVQMKAGDRISAILPACNFDPEVFSNPSEVNFHRPRRPMMAFAGGIHSCMGAHLARLEIKIGMQEWLRRIPDFSVRRDTTIEYRPGGVVGPELVPLVWT
jgi:cytochrome P450